MRGKHLWLLAVLLAVIGSGHTSFAVGEGAATCATVIQARYTAADTVQRECDINVTDVDLESLIIAICNNTGMIVTPSCQLFSVSGEARRESFEYIDRQGRRVRTEDYVESKASKSLCYSTYGNRKISKVLDDLLHERGYCWRTLGRRLLIQPKRLVHNVASGRGYIRNITTGQVVTLKYSPARAEQKATRQQAAAEALRAFVQGSITAREAAKEEAMYQAQLAFYRRPLIVNTHTTVELEQTIKPMLILRNNPSYRP